MALSQLSFITHTFESLKSSIEHIIFDLGGVLLNIDLGKITSGFADIMHYDEEAVKRTKLVTIPDYEIGKISTLTFLNSFNPYLKPGHGSEDIIRVWNSIILDMPMERLEMLKELRKSYQVHLLSNINDLHANCFEDHFRQWFNDHPKNYFDGYYYSHLIGRRKPTISTYTWVLAQLKCEPATTVFIDDTTENIEGARSAGMNAYQLMPTKTDIVNFIKELGYLAH